VNKPENVTLITRIEAELKAENDDLADVIRQKNPTRSRLRAKQESTR
jgi:hypothetical protein